jgi:hypothetical protein
MVGSDWRLAARSLEDPGLVIVSLSDPPFERWQVFDVSDPDQLPNPIGPVHIAPAFKHFPFGEAVIGN